MKSGVNDRKYGLSIKRGCPVPERDRSTDSQPDTAGRAATPQGGRKDTRGNKLGKTSHNLREKGHRENGGVAGVV